MMMSSVIYSLFDFSIRSRNRLYSAFVKFFLPHASPTCVIYKGTFFKGTNYIWIGERSVIARNGVITAWDKFEKDFFTPRIEIGDDVSIGEFCHITAINSIRIGNNVLTGRRLTVSDNSHGKSNREDLLIPPTKRRLYSKGDVSIGNNVWIGDNVVILPNVHIGESSIIGAGSVVTKDIPAFSVACGNPAMVIRQLEKPIV